MVRGSGFNAAADLKSFTRRKEGSQLIVEKLNVDSREILTEIERSMFDVRVLTVRTYKIYIPILIDLHISLILFH